MTRMCFVFDERKIAIIRDGVLCEMRGLGNLYAHGFIYPVHRMEWVKDRNELEAKFLLSGVRNKSPTSEFIPRHGYD